MTRHWVEAYVTEDCVSFNLICEHPKACMETGEQWRDQGCALLDFFAEWRTELLDFPADRKDVIGRIEVAAHWTGGGEDSDLRLKPMDLPGHKWTYPYDAHPSAAECSRCGAHDESVPCDDRLRLTDDDREFLRSAANSAPRILGEWYGDAVACVLLDHSADEYPDANILELAHRISLDARRSSRMAAVSNEELKA